MAITKRTRFEVLRRDSHACRYCGASAPDVKLTVDHVLPVALGGSDDPDNLVACCRDCNAGKSSTSPDELIVKQVADDASRWAMAMVEATRRAEESRAGEEAAFDHFKAHVWDIWTVGGHACKLPLDWKGAIRRQLAAGLTMSDLEYAVEETMSKTWVTDEFRYFMAVCRTMIAQRMDTAHAILSKSVE